MYAMFIVNNTNTMLILERKLNIIGTHKIKWQMCYIYIKILTAITSSNGVLVVMFPLSSFVSFPFENTYKLYRSKFLFVVELQLKIDLNLIRYLPWEKKTHRHIFILLDPRYLITRAVITIISTSTHRL